MYWLKNRSEYIHEKNMTEKLIREKPQLPDKVFRKNLNLFVFMNFYKLFLDDFFTRLTKFLKLINEASFSTTMLEPHPSEYYFKEFGRYGIFVSDVIDTPDMYDSALDEDPGDSPADTMFVRADIILMHGCLGRWAIYGDRDYDITVCAFEFEKDRNYFINLMENKWLISKSSAAYCFERESQEVKDFIENYCE